LKQDKSAAPVCVIISKAQPDSKAKRGESVEFEEFRSFHVVFLLTINLLQAVISEIVVFTGHIVNNMRLITSCILDVESKNTISGNNKGG
jgi:hypothetical protein